ncbi:MAG: hypothetical protein H0W44_03230 [Gammaproteobacteria bacterium]|nr:hypothetical protein [Gammaproteobacteria bacterium]
MVVIILFAGSFYFAMKGFWRIRKGHIIQDAATAKVRSAAQGYVELIGHTKLMDGLPIVSPLTDTPCVWYRYTIEEYQNNAKEGRWNTNQARTSDNLFLLEDETGCCVIDPEGAEVIVLEKNCWYGDSLYPQKGIKPNTAKRAALFAGGGGFRYTEYLLLEHEPLYAIGEFKTLGTGEDILNLEDEVRELIIKWKQDPREWTRFDSNHDGQLDLQEWQKLRKAAHQEIIDAHQHQTIAAVHVLQKPERAKLPYLLSNRDPDYLIQRYRLRAWPLVLLAIFAATAGAYLVQMRILA